MLVNCGFQFKKTIIKLEIQNLTFRQDKNRISRKTVEKNTPAQESEIIKKTWTLTELLNYRSLNL